MIGTKLGPYEITAKLGEGGMGRVYRARDPKLGREVAVKVLTEETARDPARLARLEREARVVASLAHPNVLALHDFGEDRGIAYAVFELLEGETLRTRLEIGRLSPRRAVEIAVAIARGLAAAHAKGIVHRDLKPENVFLLPDGGVKILDFGLARQAERPGAGGTLAPTAELLTEEGKLLGTVGYLAPEQVRGESARAATDLFALGCVLYEMLAGTRPFRRPTAAETMTAVLREEPPPLRPEPFAGLQRLLDHCLEKDVARRAQSATDLAFALEGTLGSVSGVTAARLRLGDTASSWRDALRRHRAAIGLAVAALVAGLAIGGALGRPRSAPPVSFQPVGFRRGSVLQARFAPDGRSVYLGAAWNGEPIDVFESPIGGAEARPLGVAPATVLAVSRTTGELAILLAPRYVYTFFQPGRLARLPAVGGSPREVLDNVNAAEWTADGRDLILARRSPGGIDVEWPMGKPIYHTTHEVSDLRLSPRGDRVAFYEHAETAEVVVVDRAGAARVVASGGNPPSRGLAWSPDGQEVWYSMAPNLERNQIWAVAPGGKPRSVLDLPAEVVIEDIAPDGRVLVEQLDYRSSIFVGDGTAADRDLSWYQNSLINDIAPDGSAIVFADGMDLGRPSFSMFLRPVGGGQAVRLGDDLGGFGAHLSPDRRWLLATSEDQQQIFVLPIGAGDVRTLAHPGVDEIRGETSWLADGSGVAYVGAGRGADTAQVFVQKLDGSPPRPVGPAGDYGELGIAPDGRRYAVETAEGVRVRSFDGGEDRLVVPDARLGHFLRWTTGGDFELFYRIGETPGAIYALDLGGGHVERRRTLMPADPVGVWRIHPVAVTPDGTKYAYSVVRWLSELFVYSGLK